MPVASGQTLILQSSSTGPGAWIPINQHVRNVSYQCTHTGSSAGVPVSCAVNLEVSNDGVNALQTTLGNITLSSGSTTNPAASPASDGMTQDTHWSWMRANIQSISTGVVQVLASWISS